MTVMWHPKCLPCILYKPVTSGHIKNNKMSVISVIKSSHLLKYDNYGLKYIDFSIGLCCLLVRWRSLKIHVETSCVVSLCLLSARLLTHSLTHLLLLITLSLSLTNWTLYFHPTFTPQLLYMEEVVTFLKERGFSCFLQEVQENSRLEAWTPGSIILNRSLSRAFRYHFTSSSSSSTTSSSTSSLSSS